MTEATTLARRSAGTDGARPRLSVEPNRCSIGFVLREQARGNWCSAVAGPGGRVGEFYRASVDEQTSRLRRLALEALKRWGVDGCEPELLKYRENAVFRVMTPDGQPAALRVHRHGYHSDDALRSELAWMQALRADGIDAPGVVPTLEHDLFATVAVAEVPERRQVDMLEWLTGEPFGSLENGLSSAITDTHGAFVRVGKLVARLHAHATRWSPPRGFARHAWDTEGLLGDRPVWGRFWELESLNAQERGLIDKTRMQARRDLIAHGAPPHAYSLIHADFLMDNLILDKDRIKVLDFDDCGFGWHLFDLATIFLFFRSADTYDTIRQAVIEGYRTVRTLSDEQLARMPLFFVVRAFTYLGWIHTRYETPAAKELAAMFTDLACEVAEEYLRGGQPATLRR
jgi:Ser/Thr protein kinase RdoA (MazF antagonist)